MFVLLFAKYTAAILPVEAEVLHVYTAEMQNLNWNDLRYLLAVKRGHSLAGAARILNVDSTTVSRRLAALSNTIGEDLFTRTRQGELELSEQGQAIIANIENIETEIDQLHSLLDNRKTNLTGSVRITSVPILINRLLVPNLKEMITQHPALQLHLIPDGRNFSLNYRETDIALRLARPVSGGGDTLARRIGQLDYAVYGPAGLSNAECKKLPWIGYDEDMSHVLTAQWISEASNHHGETTSPLKIQDSETAIEAISAGIGKSLLPICIADGIPQLERIKPGRPAISREIWLLVHRNQAKANRMIAIIDWLESILPR